LLLPAELTYWLWGLLLLLLLYYLLLLLVQII
jgi:hypothetical protein